MSRRFVFPRRAPTLAGVFAVVAVSSSAGCTQKKSRLEVISDEVEAAATKEKQQAQASLLLLPEAPLPPPGIASELWSDVHWFPASVVGINGTAPGKQPFLAQWVFSQPAAAHESCQALERGLVSGYAIEWEQPPQSFVFYGDASFVDIEECAKQIMSELGGTARLTGDTLEVDLAGSASRVLFARRGEQLVVISDDGRMGPLGDARPGRLGQNQWLLDVLGRKESGTMAWAVSTKDMTQVPLGISSRGYVMKVDTPGVRWGFRFLFADHDEAARANEAVGPFVKEAEAFVDASLDARAQVEQDTLVVSVDVGGMFSTDPAKMKALQEKLEEFAAGREAAED